MDSKYQGKYERELIEDGFKFRRILNDMALYKNDKEEVIIAKVTEKGTLEILLHSILKEKSNGDE